MQVISNVYTFHQNLLYFHRTNWRNSPGFDALATENNELPSNFDGNASNLDGLPSTFDDFTSHFDGNYIFFSLVTSHIV